MTATERIRALLDERGVEHFDGTESTLWGYESYNEATGIYRFSADESSDGYMQVRLWHATPEQAIAATLGSCNCTNGCTNDERMETCHNVWDVELTGRLLFQCSECRSVSLEITPRFCPCCGKKVVEPTTNDVAAEVVDD